MHNLPQIRLSDYFDLTDYSPRKCSECGCSLLREEIVDTINGVVSENAITCEECESSVGYWAFGRYDPSFMLSFKEEFSLDFN